MEWNVVVGGNNSGPKQDFAGAELRDSSDICRAYCGPFDSHQPLDRAAARINAGASSDDVLSELKSIPYMYVVSS